jgi:sulfur carrier protein
MSRDVMNETSNGIAAKVRDDIGSGPRSGANESAEPLTAAPAAHVLFVNGQPLAGAAGLRLDELLDRLGEPAEQVATALNGQFISRARRAEQALANGDHITVFKAIVGG